MTTVVAGAAVIVRAPSYPQLLPKSTVVRGAPLILGQTVKPAIVNASAGFLPSVNGNAYGGHGKLEGAVTELGVPVKRKVLLYIKQTMMLSAQTWSDEVDGHYVFTNLDLSLDYVVIVLDHTGAYEAAIASYVKSKVQTNAI